jgi:hypothetical protein
MEQQKIGKGFGRTRSLSASYPCAEHVLATACQKDFPGATYANHRTHSRTHMHAPPYCISSRLSAMITIPLTNPMRLSCPLP